MQVKDNKHLHKLNTKIMNPQAQEQFETAIHLNVLSINPKDINYAGLFMFMGMDPEGVSLFKHINTRKYGYGNCKQSILDACEF